MSQHFLLSPACRTLSETKVARMGEDEAHELFRKLRWSETNGEAVCPRCGCDACYHLPKRKKWRCKAYGYDFSVTAGAIFADRKMPFRDILLAIFKFVNSAKGLPALQLSRELGCDYKVAFVLLHLLRDRHLSLSTCNHPSSSVLAVSSRSGKTAVSHLTFPSRPILLI
jgi:transposase-like protein